MRGRNLAFGLGVLGAGLAVAAAAAVLLRPDVGPQPSAPATPTYRVQAEVTPAGCGAVTAREASDTSAAEPADEWTLPQNAYVGAEATATAGCTFVRFDLVVGGNVIRTSAGNPFLFHLFGNLTVRAPRTLGRAVALPSSARSHFLFSSSFPSVRSFSVLRAATHEASHPRNTRQAAQGSR